MDLTASERLAAKLNLKEDEAVIVLKPSNMFYLTEGYTGEGAVYIAAKSRVVITDFRYTEQLGRQAPAFELAQTDKDHSLNRWILALCEKHGIHTLYYEDDFVTVKDFNALRNELGSEISCIPLGNAVEQLRAIKTPHEVDCIRKACDITSQAFVQLLPFIREGVTEKELQIELDFIQLRMGAECLSFDTIMAFGENGSLPHAIPGDRRLKKGDMITMDFGCKVGGYCSDMTRTVAFGQPSDVMRNVYETVKRVQAECCAMAKAGVSCFDVDHHARSSIDAAGYVGRMGHGLGHSVGIDIHEQPGFNLRCHEPAEAGMVITIEPGIYLPGIGGVRIEDTGLITETGYERLTSADRDLIIL